MKKFWKFLGVAALAAGLTPYKIEKNEETGENSYQSLLMKVTTAPDEETGEKRRFAINLGEGVLTGKLLEMSEKKEEPHLFSDEISVEYTPAVDPAPAAAAGETEESVEAEKEVEQIGEAAAVAMPEEDAPAAEEPKTEE